MIIPAPELPNQKWSIDFVSDSTVTGRRFRALTIVDDYSRECPAIEVDTSLGGVRVVGVLERLAETRGLPEVITVDNGPEFAGKALDEWAYRRGVKLNFIRPGRVAFRQASRRMCGGTGAEITDGPMLKDCPSTPRHRLPATRRCAHHRC